MTKRTSVSGKQIPAVQYGTGTTNAAPTAPAATAAPSSYPYGHSERYVNYDYSWPIDAGGGGYVVTERRHIDNYTRQEFYKGYDTSLTLTRTWQGSQWTPWSARGPHPSDGRIGSDLHVGTTAPATPVDGDLWVSPSAGMRNQMTASSALFTTGNWYRIASSVSGDQTGGNNSSLGQAARASARFIIEDGSGLRHAHIELGVTFSFGAINKASVRVIDRAGMDYNPPVFTKARIVYKGTYDSFHVELWCSSTPTTGGLVRVTMMQDSDWFGGGFALAGYEFGSFAANPPSFGYLTREWPLPDDGSETYTPGPYEAGWSDYAAATYDFGGWLLDFGGWLHLNGIAKNSVAGATGTIFKLPPELYPRRRQLAHVPAGNTSNLARVDVLVTGEVTLQSWLGSVPILSGTWVNLAAIPAFRPVNP